MTEATSNAGFILGLEAGKLWEALQRGDGPDHFGETIHRDNLLFVVRLAENYGYSMDMSVLDEVWAAVEFTRFGTAKPPRLRLVKG